MLAYPLVSIVTPCFKDSQKAVTPLLKSILKQKYPKKKLEIVLVEILERTKLIHTPNIKMHKVFERREIGYGQAANSGFEKAKGEFILLLNSDVILGMSLLSKFVNFLLQNPTVGILGPKVYLLSHPKKISPFDLPVLGFNQLWGKMEKVTPKWLLRQRTPFSVAWISGSCMMIRREVWEALGGFDIDYFMYWEDADFCLKAKKKGYKTFLVPAAKIWHRVGASIGEKNPQRTYYLKRNSLIFMRKHTSLIAQAKETLGTIFLVLIKCFKFLLNPKSKQEDLAYLKGVWHYFR